MEEKQRDLLDCDLILKGGITSGIVYPGVAVELAKHYRFRSIGGTSAGAIAAGAIAAAEVGRQSGQDGFKKLADLPAWLAEEHNGKRNLLHLFRPNVATERLHAVLTAKLGKDRTWWHLILAFLKGYAGSFIPGSFLGFAFALIALIWGTGILGVTSFLSALVLAIVGGLGWSIYRFWLSSSTAIQKNYLGLSTGHDAFASDGPPILTDWLTGYLDDLAGIEERDAPLTFADLQRHDIDLHVITTCVTQGRPYQLPFDSKSFFIHRHDLRAFFPKKIVAWLESQHKKSATWKDSEFIQLPDQDNLPVVFAIRLSLSFPVLISAIPLYAKDWTRRNPQMERCWFTDGGVSSNFPVHLFDSALPTRPTFAVNLKPHHPDFGPEGMAYSEQQGVWMPQRNNDGLGSWWTRFDDQKGFGSLFAFIKTTVETGFNWQDSLLAAAPGQRDRIVQVGLGENEGGLNLTMDHNTIMALYERGRAAGKMLVSRFALSEHTMDWENHKWIRYRSLMAALETVLDDFHKAFETDFNLGEDYPDLLSRPQGRAPSYPLTPKKRQKLAQKITKKLLDLMDEWEDEELSLQDKAPNPRPKLRMMVDR